MKNYDMMYKDQKCSYRHHHPTHRPHRGGGAAKNSAAMGRNPAIITIIIIIIININININQKNNNIKNTIPL